eukprot:CAMPEP_0198284034 /NCGR_PEP_ID=MMETSP1449-20131203/3576_1 /TAXON_ID=420275 /ORGANISM="Attheya septentrionalis, Strain CCMP2084" /LENGTH=512 /DNA_ID=CAMNT_0043980939 /DNA_START=56 /DNA_END=1594 /DNA_ORIENTATION=-
MTILNLLLAFLAAYSLGSGAFGFTTFTRNVGRSSQRLSYSELQLLSKKDSIRRSFVWKRTHQRLHQSAEPSNEGDDALSSKMDDASLFEALNARRTELHSERSAIHEKWKTADCRSEIQLVLDDWVRRVDMDQYPVMVAGSARGSIYVADLETGDVIAEAKEVHDPVGDDVENAWELDDALSMLYGDFDGSGVLDVAIKGDLVVSAGREGGAKIWRIDALAGKLVPQGSLMALQDEHVTSLTIDTEGRLWVACYNGTLFAFDSHESSKTSVPLPLQKPLRTIRMKANILSISICEELGCGVAATSTGSVRIFSLEHDKVLAKWNPFQGRTYARSATIVGTSASGDSDCKSSKSEWALICGGGNGRMYVHKLNVDPVTGTLLESRPLFVPLFGSKKRASGEMKPSHNGPVVCLTPASSSGSGMLVSGAQDGSVRIWDCTSPIETVHSSDSDPLSSPSVAPVDSRISLRPRCLYQFMGYKVWLGSICTDGLRLVSDGSDNTIFVHDFTQDSEDL